MDLMVYSNRALVPTRRVSLLHGGSPGKKRGKAHDGPSVLLRQVIFGNKSEFIG